MSDWRAIGIWAKSECRSHSDMKLVMIAAIGKNRELGLQGDMPWKHALKKDLQFFKKTTLGHPMVMGRKTLESFPGLLPGRLHLVISTSDLKKQDILQPYQSLEAFLEDWQKRKETVYVVGGGSLYHQLLPYADALILTEIDAEFDADTWFPNFDPENYERTVLNQDEEAGYAYEHVCYKRKPAMI